VQDSFGNAVVDVKLWSMLSSAPIVNRFLCKWDRHTPSSSSNLVHNALAKPPHKMSIIELMSLQAIKK